jgi:hypothetical protein
MGLSSIEQCFERMAVALERIAAACENIKSPRPIYPMGEGPIVHIPGEVHAPQGTVDAIAHAMNQAADQRVYPAKTYEEAQSALLSLISRKGQVVAKDLLTRFHVKYLKDLSPGQYGALVSQANEL